MSLISVVIPVYNLEKYLSRCIKSILNQTYKELEVILVNDGSSDGSCKICKYYEGKYKNIIFIDKENGGVSSARNEGIRAAKGKYIGFVDGDDWIEPNTYEILVRRIENEESDMCISDRYFYGEEIINNELLIKNTYTRSEALNLHVRFHFQASACLALYRTKIIKGVYFDQEIHTLEDWEFLLRAILHMKSISISREIFYHYTINDESVSHRLTDRMLSCFKITNKEYRLDDIGDGLVRESIENIEQQLVLHLIVAAANSKNIEERYNRIFKQKSRENLLRSLRSSQLLKRQKLYTLLIAISPRLYYAAYSIKIKINGVKKWKKYQ